MSSGRQGIATWTAAAFALLLATTAAAQEAAGVERLTGTLQKARETKTVTIGFRDASVPFSYLNRAREPIGYSIDLCLALVEAMQTELGVDALKVKYVPVNPRNRIEMVVGGVVDLECGQTTNNAERRKQVAFSPTIFVSGTKLLVPRSSKLRSYRDLKGKTVVVTEGTTNQETMRSLDARERLQLSLVPVRENGDALQAVATNKAEAWAGDDVVLFASAAESETPTAFKVLDEYVSYEPLAIMYRIDPALDALIVRTFEELARTRELARIYDQWFLRKLPSGKRLGIVMRPQLESVFESLGQPSE